MENINNQQTDERDWTSSDGDSQDSERQTSSNVTAQGHKNAQHQRDGDQSADSKIQIFDDLKLGLNENLEKQRSEKNSISNAKESNSNEVALSHQQTQNSNPAGQNQQQQHQSQQHQYSAHFTGSTNDGGAVKKPQEMSALDRLKTIQSNYRRTWNGIDCSISGRAGTSNFVNKKRTFTIPETFYEEEERQRQLDQIFGKIKDIEEDRLLLGSTQNSTQSFNKTASSSTSGVGGFFQSSNMTSASNMYSGPQNAKKRENEFIPFKNIKDNQLITHSQPYSAYPKSYHIESSDLLYKLLRFDNKLLRTIFETNGFTHTESHEWNILWTCSSGCKSYLYEGLNEYQKINHFPQSYEITRKDRLCYNMVRMQEKFGKQNFDFVPDTYILPDEFGDFYAHFQKLKQHDSRKNVWIVKPANSSQGKGIYIVDDINDVNVDDTSVISRYVTNPLLINGHKFDLRIYVLVTCYEPMRIYIFQEGLARFASETYTSKINKNNKYMHLTNYSINKKNENFVQNENAEQDDFGFKWSLGAFCKHLEQVGIDMNLLWSRINDVIIKTIISGEHHVTAAMKKNGTHRTNCFELFGFDILIDSDLKPWLLEVNLSPSLATDAPLDLTIKSNLVTDVFNLIGVKRFDRKKESLNKIKNRMKGYQKQGAQKKTGLGNGIQGTGLQPTSFGGQNEIFHQPTGAQLYQLIDRYAQENPQEFGGIYHETVRRAISLRQKEYLRETLQEYQRKGNFLRIYPSKNSDIYDCFFNGPRTFNKLVYKVLYTDEILKCIQPKPNYDMKLNYKIEIPPGSYEQYKNKNNDKTVSSQQQQYRQPTKEEQKAQQNADQTRDQLNAVQRQIVKERPQTGHPTSQALQSQAIHQQLTPMTTKGGQSQQSTDNSQLMQSTTNNSQLTSQQQETTANSQQQQSSSKGTQEKVLITGDDILIEYVERLMNALKQVVEDRLTEAQQVALDKFITHYVWHSQERRMEGEGNPMRPVYTPYWFRLEGRLNEMQERRRRLIKYLYKKENKLNEFEEGFKQSISKKSSIIKKFTSVQLEDLLRTSTKNVAQEVVSSLIPQNGGLGVLAELEKIYQIVDPRRKAEKRDDPSAYEANNGGGEIDANARANHMRQSKSANAARSLTRKNQAQLPGMQEEPHLAHSSSKNQNSMQSANNNSATRQIVKPMLGVNPTSQTRAIYTAGNQELQQQQQNLTDFIQKREISNNYVKRILDNQMVKL